MPRAGSGGRGPRDRHIIRANIHERLLLVVGVLLCTSLPQEHMQLGFGARNFVARGAEVTPQLWFARRFCNGRLVEPALAARDNFAAVVALRISF